MRASLEKWIGDAEALRHLGHFGLTDIPLDLAYQQTRKDDLYIALVGELFDCMRGGHVSPSEWARLGNALAEYGSADRRSELRSLGIAPGEAALFSAAAFYFGGFPASASLVMRNAGNIDGNDGVKACFDLLARPVTVTSALIRTLLSALIGGDSRVIDTVADQAVTTAQSALDIGPDEWIPARLLAKLIAGFKETNLRAVLPEGQSEFWTPLISQFCHRGVWEFFPSQIQAIRNGLLLRSDTSSLQMPTGAGKTALSETLLYWHLRRNPENVAVLLVPYRSLASELRSTLAPRLNLMGLSARCAYGGTVPTGDEVQAFDDTRALIATPETLSGILSANSAFFRRISLVIVDEGHLLDAPSRGIGLELLLARMKAREGGPPRFVFVSAIVPNIEEINLWLGGTQDSVVRSDYRPALAEFAVLRSGGGGTPVDLEMHPHESRPVRFRIEGFLRRKDFQWLSRTTNRVRTYPFSSIKTRAIAAARKALTMGAVVVFATNKRGNQGAIGLAHELLSQLEQPLPMPTPIAYANVATVNLIAEYLEQEYGPAWIGNTLLKAGAVLHHADIPQESREVLEAVLRRGHVKFAICTSTLAEGVNLPIRTLVLYSLQRRGRTGRRENLLTRDVKNLVGRAGRAGVTTKGLVICANEEQWHIVEPVARQAAGEAVLGALIKLIENVRRQLAARNLELTNELLERSSPTHSLIDGIDATLVDLAATEIGEEELVRQAALVADQTFAVRQTDAASNQLLRDIFTLRARKMLAIRSAGRLDWVKDTGTHARMLELVEVGLLPLRERWDNVDDPSDPEIVNVFLDWAWSHGELQEAVRDAYGVGDNVGTDSLRPLFFESVRLWLSGRSFKDIAISANLGIDEMLRLHARAIAFELQTIVEQAVALLGKLLEGQGVTLSPAVSQFPEYLRFGVPSQSGRMLAGGGVRHRRAFVQLGVELAQFVNDDRFAVFRAAQRLVAQDPGEWRVRLGQLVMENTLNDLEAVTGVPI